MSAVGGIGSVLHYTTWDLGGGLIYYPVGDFEEGIQLGITVFYLSVSGKDVALGLETTSRTGALVEYFYIGYKYTASFGLVVSGQLGAPVRIQGIGFPNDEGVSSAISKFSTTKFVNLNIGWSF